MSPVKYIAGDCRAGRRRRNVQKMTGPALTSAVPRCAIWNTTESTDLGAAAGATRERSGATDGIEGVTLRHFWLSDWMAVLVCMNRHSRSCSYELFIRYAPGPGSSSVSFRVCCFLPAISNGPQSAAAKRHLGELAMAASWSSEKICFGNKASIILSPTSTNNRSWCADLRGHRSSTKEEKQKRNTSGEK